MNSFCQSLEILSEFWLGISNMKNINIKNLKNISEELITIVWHLKRWWNSCMSQDEKKRNRTNFYSVLLLTYII